ncbi:unnamed protein product [Ceutorhynchus assimilis]|uniref:DUF4806 domain-containing protein n=1 Tax=Ceutorhynchus assimilis TaxID=467358 RepID=A0A9P0DQH0_9CUCU|nr:unnamed protein product [Ceutorhynchus assimilis]
MQARAKSKEAEYCSASDLLSDRDNSSKRKRIQKALSSSSSSAEDELPIKAPKLIIKKKIHKASITFQKELRRDSPVEAENLAEFNEDIYNPVPSTSKENNDNQPVPVTPSNNCCFQKEHLILTDLKNQNHLLRTILTDVLNEIKKRPIVEPGTAVTKSIFNKFQNITFPINTQEDFNFFEEEMRKPENFNEAVNELAKYGGSNPYNFIKRSMSAVLGDNILKNYSWLGRKGKERLDQKTDAKVFISAAELCGFDNKKIVELAIQSYIKRSFERLNAKENKKK